MTEPAELQILRHRLERLAHLAGHAAAIAQRALELDITGIALQGLSEEGDDLMGIGTVLREEAANVRASAEQVEAAIQAALGRLGDNATAEDIAAARESLQGASDANARALTAAGAIDPDQPGGVVDDGEGGVVEGEGNGEGDPPSA